MSTPKKLIWGFGVVLVIGLIVGGYFWNQADEPKPERQVSLTRVGVGLYLARNQETHKFEVTRVFENSPADKAGIGPGLILNKVDGFMAETNNIHQLTKLLTGPVGSKVMIEVMDTNGEIKDIEITRATFLNHAKAAATE